MLKTLFLFHLITTCIITNLLFVQTNLKLQFRTIMPPFHLMIILVTNMVHSHLQKFKKLGKILNHPMKTRRGGQSIVSPCLVRPEQVGVVHKNCWNHSERLSSCKAT